MDIKGMLIGGAVGDVLGLPVWNQTRISLESNPVREIFGDDEEGIPLGMFSDDTTSTWILADTIAEGYSIESFAKKMMTWYKDGRYTATGVRIDIKEAVVKALDRYAKTGRTNIGGKTEAECGNGSIMRIAPMVLVTRGKKIDERIELIREHSSFTHAHATPILSCFFLTEFLLELDKSKDKDKAYAMAQNKLKYVFNKGISKAVQTKFERLYPSRIWQYAEAEIETPNYSLNALEAALWCFFNTKNYKDAVLTAVNLGGETDTVAAITGTIAGLHYGYDSIPNEWKESLLRRCDLEALAERLQDKFN
jgi:ADP-ribosyl-[dinitrogen reductase] hydrolase